VPMQHYSWLAACLLSALPYHSELRMRSRLGVSSISELRSDCAPRLVRCDHVLACAGLELVRFGSRRVCKLAFRAAWF